MPYAALVIAAFGLAIAIACFFYMQIARESPPTQVIIGSIAGTIVGLLALTFALVY